MLDKKDKIQTKKTLLSSNPETINSEDTHKLLLSLNTKMETNPVLNGGFDVLLEKIKNIEEDISELKESVYDQNDGIFSKVKSLENQNNLTNLEIKSKIHVFEEVLQKHEKKIEENSKSSDEYMEKLNASIQKIELQLSEIDIWKKVSLAIGGALIGILLENVSKVIF